jgi:hypothetical protein
MSQRNPASILLDVNGNLVGVMYDGAVYRLQVETLITGPEGSAVSVETMGNREALAVSYPEMLKVLERIDSQLTKLNVQIASITGEDDPL